MTLMTYPLDNIDYSADDAALFHATRTSGIFSGEDFSFSVSGADNFITLNPGLAWMRTSRWKGLCAALKAQTEVDLALPDAVYPRIDRVVLQFDANRNDTRVVVKKGSPGSSPLAPARSVTEALYELHLLEVRREPGAVAISAAVVTDLRLDEDCCGLMADTVTHVDTAAINAQFQALLAQVRQELNRLEAGAAVELKKLQFTDTVVSSAAFAANASSAEYPYRAAVALSGCLATMIPEVIFGLEEAAGGNFAPVAESYNGGVYLYASEPPQGDIIIPTILLWRGTA